MAHHLQNSRPDQFRVLVVIDEIYAQKAIVEYVHQEGYRVSGTGDLKEAARMFAAEKSDLVIVDMTRPQLHAEKLVTALKKAKPDLVAIAMADTVPGVDEQAEDVFEGYLVKPITRETVGVQLSELLLTTKDEESPKVYVVDDDANALMAVEHTLDVRGFEVTTYPDIGLALDHIKHEPPDLLILDVNMPGVNGIQICKQMKSNPRTSSIPILIFTSDPSRENVQNAIASGANGFIAKPFDPKGLTAKVREVLEQSG